MFHLRDIEESISILVTFRNVIDPERLFTSLPGSWCQQHGCCINVNPQMCLVQLQPLATKFVSFFPTFLFPARRVKRKEVSDSYSLPRASSFAKNAEQGEREIY